MKGVFVWDIQQNFEVTESGVLIGTKRQGVFLSTDNGKNRTAFNTGLPDYPAVSSIAISDSVIYASVKYPHFGV